MSYGNRKDYSHLYILTERSSCKRTEECRRKCKRIVNILNNYKLDWAAISIQASQAKEKVLIPEEERKSLCKDLQQFKSVAEADDGFQIHTPRAHTTGLSAPDTTEKVTSTVMRMKYKMDSPRHIQKILERIKYMQYPPIRINQSTSRITKMVQPIPLDMMGCPVLPIVLGGLTVNKIGELVLEAVASIFNHEDPSIIYYKHERFEIVADSDSDAPFVGKSADHCHQLLLRKINRVLGAQVVNTRGQGPEFFGFSNPTIQNWIQNFAAGKQFMNYKWIDFEMNHTGEPVMEENDATLNFEALQLSIGLSKSICHIGGRTGQAS